MDRSAFYKTWAPDPVVWSRWVKPAFFLQIQPSLTTAQGRGEIEGTEPPWLSSVSDRTAVIVDLPGVEGIRLGLGLAMKGYRPIPLYNAWDHPKAVLNLKPLHEALVSATEELRRISIPENAPPAFLLDADRMYGFPIPGKFDNRWIVFPQDFPSARFLISNDIKRVLLIKSYDGLKDDLIHVLRRYQDDGLSLSAVHPQGDRPAELSTPKPSWYRSALYRVTAYTKYRRSNAGGFGGIVPEPSSGGYG